MSSNILDIYVNATSGFITLNTSVPKQNLILKSYRIAFGTTGQALACQFIKFEAPFLRSNNFTSGVTSTDTTYTSVNSGGIVMFVDNSLAGVIRPNIKVGICDDIPETFAYRLTGINLTGFIALHMVFEYSQGSIS